MSDRQWRRLRCAGGLAPAWWTVTAMILSGLLLFVAFYRVPPGAQADTPRRHGLPTGPQPSVGRSLMLALPRGSWVDSRPAARLRRRARP